MTRMEQLMQRLPGALTVRGFPQMSTADILPEWHLLPEM